MFTKEFMQKETQATSNALLELLQEINIVSLPTLRDFHDCFLSITSFSKSSLMMQRIGCYTLLEDTIPYFFELQKKLLKSSFIFTKDIKQIEKTAEIVDKLQSTLLYKIQNEATIKDDYALWRALHEEQKHYNKKDKITYSSKEHEEKINNLWEKEKSKILKDTTKVMTVLLWQNIGVSHENRLASDFHSTFLENSVLRLLFKNCSVKTVRRGIRQEALVIIPQEWLQQILYSKKNNIFLKSNTKQIKILEKEEKQVHEIGSSLWNDDKNNIFYHPEFILETARKTT